MPDKPPPTKATKIPVSYELSGSMKITAIVGWSSLHGMWAFDEVSVTFDHGVAGNYLAATMKAAAELLDTSVEHFMSKIPDPEDL